MGYGSWWQILIASIGFGFGGEAVRQYRRFKARRWAMHPTERNAGFWTDRKLYRAEALFAAAALSLPFGIGTMLVSLERPVWVSSVCLIAYAGAIYLLLSSINANPDQ